MDKPRDDDDSRHLLHNSVAQISHLVPSMPTHVSHTFSIAQEKANTDYPLWLWLGHPWGIGTQLTEASSQWYKGSILIAYFSGLLQDVES